MIAGATALRQIADAVRDPRISARLEAWARILERAPEARRAVIAQAIAVVEPALSPMLGDTAIRLASETPYPEISEDLAARLILGETPVDLAPGLTRPEARAWLLAGGQDPGKWLLDRAATIDDWIADTVPIPIARWLVGVCRDPPRLAALTRQRSELLAGQRIEGRYIDRLDELRPVDLKAGQSVEAVFRRAGERLLKALERTLQTRGGRPLAPTPRWWRPAKCARLLITGPDLIAEGRAMKHCVATYAPMVERGDCWIVGLCVLGQRSTVEILPGPRIGQHCGRGNAAPHPLCVRALAVLLRRWGVTS